MKIELTIEKSYRSNWKWESGVREILQNAKDAEVEFGAKMVVDHYGGDTLRVENTGTTLDKDALLLGFTTKAGRDDLIGQFGDGLVCGLLALVREGYSVKIRNGAEIWEPTIERSEKFGKDVLVFHIRGGNKNESRVRFEIKGISKEQWEEVQGSFIFMIPKTKLGKKVQTSSGTLFLDPAMKGKIFVKGIFVEHVENLSYGYDLKNAEVDIDRKLVKRFDLNWETRNIWQTALRSQKDLLDPFFTLLQEGAEDLEGFEHAASCLPEEVTNHIAEKFKERHGSEAVAVTSLADSRDLEHLGKTGIIVPKPMAAIIEQTQGGIQTVKDKLTKEVLHRYSWSELSESEQMIFEKTVSILESVTQPILNRIEVCDFRSPTIEGLHQGDKLYVARRMLDDTRKTLIVLVHEYAHDFGIDGAPGHIQQMEEIWSKIAMKFMES